MSKWNLVSLKDIVNNLDNKRVPLNSSQRQLKESKPLYPYIGANNIMGYIDEYIFDEKILCVAEDGGSWGYNQRCAVLYNEKVWVNNHAHILKEKEKGEGFIIARIDENLPKKLRDKIPSLKSN